MAGMSAGSQPSYDEVAAENLVLREQIAVLVARIAELEARLNQNSRNSSKPPGSDSPFVKPVSSRKKGQRRAGRPDGQGGVTLAQVADPRYIREYEPELCHSCGSGLAGAPEAGRERRQVFDLPELAVEVTEHQVVRRCGCGQVCRAVPPAGVTAPAVCGPQVAGLVVELWNGQFLARERGAQVMGQVFGAPMAPGTVASMATRCARALGGFQDAVRDKLAGAEVVNVDETVFRVQTKLQWVHSPSTGKYSLLTVHPRRGSVAMDAMGVLPAFTGIAQHDAWARAAEEEHARRAAATSGECDIDILVVDDQLNGGAIPVAHKRGKGGRSVLDHACRIALHVHVLIWWAGDKATLVSFLVHPLDLPWKRAYWKMVRHRNYQNAAFEAHDRHATLAVHSGDWALGHEARETAPNYARFVTDPFGPLTVAWDLAGGRLHRLGGRLSLIAAQQEGGFSEFCGNRSAHLVAFASQYRLDLADPVVQALLDDLGPSSRREESGP
jgi:transposase